METERLIIRTIKKIDLEDICEYGCDEETGQYMMYWPKTKEEINVFIDECIARMKIEKPTWYEFAVQLKKDLKVIGNITLQISNEKAEMGWISNKKYWNNGYMSEAVQRVINYSFKELNIHKIFATCTDKNIASYKTMEKCHMKRIRIENNYESISRGLKVTYNKLTYCIESR